VSHASVIVALSPEDLGKAGGSVEAAVAHQMAPFDENGTWFRDGSRWDWWCIGGRFSGKFAAPGYDPSKDPTNTETCFLCQGTGKRNDALGYEQRLRDPSYTCNGCRGTGKQLKSASDWADVGNVVRRAELTLELLEEKARKSAEATWAEWEAEARKDAFVRDHVYGINEGETRDGYLARRGGAALTAWAFLHNRTWHECGRMGWFGSLAPTECEFKAADKGEVHEGRCLYRNESAGASIVSWTGGGDNERVWNERYYKRFIENLPGDTLLVVVDYHS
jgi:hypothetical protein